MRKLLFVFLTLIVVVSCSKNENNLHITGTIKGLKKGALYLEKIEDTAVITIDSIIISGTPDFSFSTFIDEPQLLFLYIKKTDGVEFYERIDFFAEPGSMAITTSLDNFETDVTITGSANHEKLNEYHKLMHRYNDRALDLLEAGFNAGKNNKEEEVDKIESQYQSVMRSKYLATVNYALSNKDKEIAPYLALSQIYDANIKYLDTVYNALTPEIKESKYGVELKNYILERKKVDDSD